MQSDLIALSERLCGIEHRLLGVETLLRHLNVTNDTHEPSTMAQSLRDGVYLRGLGERMEIAENVIRGIHSKLSQLFEQFAENSTELQHLNRGLQRHGEQCDISTEKIEARWQSTCATLQAHVKRVKDLQSQVDELRSRKVDAASLKATVSEAVAEIASQVRKLSACEARRQREIHGNDCRSYVSQSAYSSSPSSFYLGLEVCDEPCDAGVRVVRVIGSFRAAAAGLIKGDLIVKIDGIVVHSRKDFVITRFPAQIEFVRDGKLMEVTLED